MVIRGINVIGHVKRSYRFKFPKDEVLQTLLGLIEKSDDVEGVIKWKKTIEISSLAKIRANLFEKKKKYWAKGSVVESAGFTKISLKIGTYWVWEFSIVIGLIIAIVFEGLIIYDHFNPIFTRKGEFAEFGTITMLVVYCLWLYRVWEFKKSGTTVIDSIMKEVERQLNVG